MGMDGGIRDFSRPPTLMPNVLLTISLLLCMVAGRRGATWLVAGLLMLGLSFGTRQNVPTLLGAWLGGPAEILGASVITFGKLGPSDALDGKTGNTDRFKQPCTVNKTKMRYTITRRRIDFVQNSK